MQVATTINKLDGVIVKRVSVPVGLEEIMEGLTKEVLLKKPKDLYKFAYDYFSRLLALRQEKELKERVHTARSAIRVEGFKPKPSESVAPRRQASKQLSRQLRIRNGEISPKTERKQPVNRNESSTMSAVRSRQSSKENVSTKTKQQGKSICSEFSKKEETGNQNAPRGKFFHDRKRSSSRESTKSKASDKIDTIRRSNIPTDVFSDTSRIVAVVEGVAIKDENYKGAKRNESKTKHTQLSSKTTNQARNQGRDIELVETHSSDKILSSIEEYVGKSIISVDGKRDQFNPKISVINANPETATSFSNEPEQDDLSNNRNNSADLVASDDIDRNTENERKIDLQRTLTNGQAQTNSSGKSRNSIDTVESLEQKIEPDVLNQGGVYKEPKLDLQFTSDIPDNQESGTKTENVSNPEQIKTNMPNMDEFHVEPKQNLQITTGLINDQKELQKSSVSKNDVESVKTPPDKLRSYNNITDEEITSDNKPAADTTLEKCEVENVICAEQTNETHFHINNNTVVETMDLQVGSDMSDTGESASINHVHSVKSPLDKKDFKNDKANMEAFFSDTKTDANIKFNANDKVMSIEDKNSVFDIQNNSLHKTDEKKAGAIINSDNLEQAVRCNSVNTNESDSENTARESSKESALKDDVSFSKSPPREFECTGSIADKETNFSGSREILQIKSDSPSIDTMNQFAENGDASKVADMTNELKLETGKLAPVNAEENDVEAPDSNFLPDNIKNKVAVKDNRNDTIMPGDANGLDYVRKCQLDKSYIVRSVANDITVENEVSTDGKLLFENHVEPSLKSLAKNDILTFIEKEQNHVFVDNNSKVFNKDERQMSHSKRFSEIPDAEKPITGDTNQKSLHKIHRDVTESAADVAEQQFAPANFDLVHDESFKTNAASEIGNIKLETNGAMRVGVESQESIENSSIENVTVVTDKEGMTLKQPRKTDNKDEAVGTGDILNKNHDSSTINNLARDEILKFIVGEQRHVFVNSNLNVDERQNANQIPIPILNSEIPDHQVIHNITNDRQLLVSEETLAGKETGKLIAKAKRFPESLSKSSLPGEEVEISRDIVTDTVKQGPELSNNIPLVKTSGLGILEDEQVEFVEVEQSTSGKFRDSAVENQQPDFNSVPSTSKNQPEVESAVVKNGYFSSSEIKEENTADDKPENLQTVSDNKNRDGSTNHELREICMGANDETDTKLQSQVQQKIGILNEKLDIKQHYPDNTSKQTILDSSPSTDSFVDHKQEEEISFQMILDSSKLVQDEKSSIGDVKDEEIHSSTRFANSEKTVDSNKQAKHDLIYEFIHNEQSNVFRKSVEETVDSRTSYLVEEGIVGDQAKAEISEDNTTISRGDNLVGRERQCSPSIFNKKENTSLDKCINNLLIPQEQQNDSPKITNQSSEEDNVKGMCITLKSYSDEANVPLNDKIENKIISNLNAREDKSSLFVKNSSDIFILYEQQNALPDTSKSIKEGTEDKGVYIPLKDYSDEESFSKENSFDNSKNIMTTENALSDTEIKSEHSNRERRSSDLQDKEAITDKIKFKHEVNISSQNKTLDSSDPGGSLDTLENKEIIVGDSEPNYQVNGQVNSWSPLDEINEYKQSKDEDNKKIGFNGTEQTTNPESKEMQEQDQRRLLCNGEVLEPTRSAANIPNETAEESARKIQALWRSYRFRKDAQASKQVVLSSSKTSNAKTEKSLNLNDAVINGIIKIQAKVRGYIERKRYNRSKKESQVEKLNQSNKIENDAAKTVHVKNIVSPLNNDDIETMMSKLDLNTFGRSLSVAANEDGKTVLSESAKDDNNNDNNCKSESDIKIQIKDAIENISNTLLNMEKIKNEILSSKKFIDIKNKSSSQAELSEGVKENDDVSHMDAVRGKNDVHFNHHKETTNDGENITSEKPPISKSIMPTNKGTEKGHPSIDTGADKVRKTINIEAEKARLDALKGHVDLIDQVQNKILDQIAGKTTETKSTFDIDQLRQELEEAAALYKDIDDFSDIPFPMDHNDELLQYLSYFDTNPSEKFDLVVKKPRPIGLPDIKEEDAESRTDFVSLDSKVSESTGINTIKNTNSETSSNDVTHILEDIDKENEVQSTVENSEILDVKSPILIEIYPKNVAQKDAKSALTGDKESPFNESNKPENTLSNDDKNFSTNVHLDFNSADSMEMVKPNNRTNELESSKDSPNHSLTIYETIEKSRSLNLDNTNSKNASKSVGFVTNQSSLSNEESFDFTSKAESTGDYVQPNEEIAGEKSKILTKHKDLNYGTENNQLTRVLKTEGESKDIEERQKEKKLDINSSNLIGSQNTHDSVLQTKCDKSAEENHFQNASEKIVKCEAHTHTKKAQHIDSEDFTNKFISVASLQKPKSSDDFELEPASEKEHINHSSSLISQESEDPFILEKQSTIIEKKISTKELTRIPRGATKSYSGNSKIDSARDVSKPKKSFSSNSKVPITRKSSADIAKNGKRTASVLKKSSSFDEEQSNPRLSRIGYSKNLAKIGKQKTIQQTFHSKEIYFLQSKDEKLNMGKSLDDFKQKGRAKDEDNKQQLDTLNKEKIDEKVNAPATQGLSKQNSDSPEESCNRGLLLEPTVILNNRNTDHLSVTDNLIHSVDTHDNNSEAAMNDEKNRKNDDIVDGYPILKSNDESVEDFRTNQQEPDTFNKRSPIASLVFDGECPFDSLEASKNIENFNNSLEEKFEEADSTNDLLHDSLEKNIDNEEIRPEGEQRQAELNDEKNVPQVGDGANAKPQVRSEELTANIIPMITGLDLSEKNGSYILNKVSVMKEDEYKKGKDGREKTGIIANIPENLSLKHERLKNIDAEKITPEVEEARGELSNVDFRSIEQREGNKSNIADQVSAIKDDKYKENKCDFEDSEIVVGIPDCVGDEISKNFVAKVEEVKARTTDEKYKSLTEEDRKVKSEGKRENITANSTQMIASLESIKNNEANIVDKVSAAQGNDYRNMRGAYNYNIGENMSEVEATKAGVSYKENMPLKNSDNKVKFEKEELEGKNDTNSESVAITVKDEGYKKIETGCEKSGDIPEMSKSSLVKSEGVKNRNGNLKEEKVSSETTNGRSELDEDPSSVPENDNLSREKRATLSGGEDENVKVMANGIDILHPEEYNSTHMDDDLNETAAVENKQEIPSESLKIDQGSKLVTEVSMLEHSETASDIKELSSNQSCRNKLTRGSKSLDSALNSNETSTSQEAPAGDASVTYSPIKTNRHAVDNDVRVGSIARAQLKPDLNAKRAEHPIVYAPENRENTNASSRSQNMASGENTDTEKKNEHEPQNENMETEAATKIQAGFRGYQVRRQLKLKHESDKKQPKKRDSSKNKPEEIEEKSAVKIQAGVRGFLVRRRQKKHNNSSASA